MYGAILKLYLVPSTQKDQRMKLSRAVKSISYLKQHTADAIKEVAQSSSPMVITQNGEAKAVLIDIVEYEQTQASFALFPVG